MQAGESMGDGHRRTLDHKRMIGIDEGIGAVLWVGHLQGNVKAVAESLRWCWTCKRRLVPRRKMDMGVPRAE